MTEVFRIVPISKATFETLNNPSDYVRGRVDQQTGSKYRGNPLISGPEISFKNEGNKVIGVYKALYKD